MELTPVAPDAFDSIKAVLADFARSVQDSITAICEASAEFVQSLNATREPDSGFRPVNLGNLAHCISLA